MSRPLVILALAVLVVAGLAPLVVMLARVTSADLTSLVEPRTLGLLGRTLLLGSGAAAAALVLGTAFGFLVARTDVPMAGLIRTLGVVPLFLPPLVLAMTWATLWPSFRGVGAALFVLSLSTFPLVAAFAARAFERVDGRAEEAARLAGGFPAVLAMELALARPALFAGAALAFAFAVNDFGVPDYVSSVGPKFGVYADEIKLTWDQFHAPGRAVAAALPLIALTLAALVPALAARRRGAFGTLGHDFQTPGRLALGPWRWPGFAFAVAILALACFAPMLRLLWEAGGVGARLATQGLARSLLSGVAALPDEFSLALERARPDLGRSLLYAVGAAALAVPTGFVLGHTIERARLRGLGRALELGVLVPLAAPAILFGIGVVVLWNHGWSAGFYASGGLVVLLHLGRYLAIATLISSGAVASVDPALEEAAALAGARPAERLVRIVAPLLKGSLAAAFVMVFVFAMRDLDAAVLVPAANQTAIFRVYNGVHFGRDAYVAALTLLLVFAILLPGILWSLFARRRLEVLP